MSAPARPSYAQSLASTSLCLLLLAVTAPISLLICSITFLLSYRSSLAAHRSKGNSSTTVLVTGCRTTKALVVARIFWKAGYRVVIADEAEWGWLSATRFSRCISAYYNLPDPTKDHARYERKIREIIARENVKLWIPGSSAGGTVNDARVGEIVREMDGVKAFIQSTREIGMLHNKDLFGDLVKDLGFTVPESVLIHSVEEGVKFLHSDDRKGREYILKTTDLDDQGRSDMTRMPFPSEAKTRAHLSKVPRGISEAHPYVLQQFIPGYEFCTHCHAIDGVPQSFLSCPSSDMLMRYVDCKTSYSSHIAEAAEQWTRDFLTRWKEKLDEEGGKYHLTGHFSFDFIVDPNDGILYPIECNPRIHTAIVLLSGLSPDLMADSYFGRKKNGVLTPPHVAREHYSWAFHALPIALARAILPQSAQKLIHPLLPAGNTNAYETSVPAITISPTLNHSLPQLIMDYVDGSEKDPLLDWQDPMPFAAQHVMWLWLLGRLVFLQGKGWSRVNVSTSRLFSV